MYFGAVDVSPCEKEIENAPSYKLRAFDCTDIECGDSCCYLCFYNTLRLFREYAIVSKSFDHFLL